MNTILHTHTHYLRPSRTIETLLLTDGLRQKMVYVYNYEGYHFRVFDEGEEVLNFFEGMGKPIMNFENESELDAFLLNWNIE